MRHIVGPDVVPEARLRRWTEAELISPDQAAAIAAFERARMGMSERRLPVLVEVAAFVGSVLALMGGAAAVGPNWDRIPIVGRLALAITVTVVGLVAGHRLLQLGEPGGDRLGAFLHVVAVGGAAMMTGTVMAEIDPQRPAWTTCAMGATVCGTGAALWRNQERPVQFLTTVVGLVVVVAGTAELTGAPSWLVGPGLMVIGGSVAVGGAQGLVRPRPTALVVGALLTYAGAFVLSDVNEHLGPALALAVAALAIAFALADGLIVLLVAGVIGALGATQALLLTTFTGPVASAIVAATGVVIIVVTATRAVRAGRDRVTSA